MMSLTIGILISYNGVYERVFGVDFG